MTHIPLARPWFDETDERAVLETLRSGWVGTGPRVTEFERRFSDYVGGAYSVAVSSGTSALNIAAQAAGFGPGDEILVPAFTWVSTPNCIELTGARAMFCDIDPATFNLDIRDAERRITSRTRGIIPVHMFGRAADMIEVTELAHRHGLVVIEDAACALGARIEGRHVGTFGDAGCFSFHPRKSITTGEGGMLTSRDESFVAKFRMLRDIGADRSALSAQDAACQLMADHPVLGNNCRLTDLQASLGLAQLSKFDKILASRMIAAREYDRLIGESRVSEWLATPELVTNGEHAYQAYVCTVRESSPGTATVEDLHARRNRLMKALYEAGIATRPGTHAPHALGYYRDRYGWAPTDFPNAWRASLLTIALPLYVGLSPDDQALVCSALDRCWKASA